MAEALKRRIGPGVLRTCGLGTIDGARGDVLLWAPLGFVLAGLIAGLSHAHPSISTPLARRGRWQPGAGAAPGAQVALPVLRKPRLAITRRARGKEEAR